ncbi:uncharacterized protein [Dysidea avara]|uniref:uncharacterized protein isoform X13 n=1 Tax=Dysidea avara TaxID=196820 RepID=UPI0033167299
MTARCVISSCCQDVSSFGGYLPRCFILLMCHKFLLPRCVIFRWLPAKMFHLIDVSSFGGYLPRGFIFGRRTQCVNMLTVAAGMYHLITFSCFVNGS